MPANPACALALIPGGNGDFPVMLDAAGPSIKYGERLPLLHGMMLFAQPVASMSLGVIVYELGEPAYRPIANEFATPCGMLTG